MQNPAKGLIVSPTKGLFFNPFKEQIAHAPVPEPKVDPALHVVEPDATNDAETDEEEFWGR